VSVPGLSLYDHGALPGLAASRGITCEGLPTGRTDLIRDGLLVGCLASWYDAQRLLHDPALAAKLGATAAVAAPALIARHGFRVGATGAGRAFDAAPTTAPSNVMLEAAGAVDHDELLRAVGQGLYVGRIWYTYPVNGLRSGDFTCTAVGDSFIIRDGRLAAPVKANAIRINDNIGRLLGQVVGVTHDVRATPVWGADEVIHAPEIAVAGVPVEEIGQFMEDEA
jgi:PmbA protein